MARKGLIKDLTLALSSIIFAEVLSTSTPLWDLLNPVSLTLLLGLYGSGVILAREYSVAKRWTYAGLFAVGMAYGVLEEGVAVKTFFDTDPKKAFGRLFGVNWHWAYYITLYHAVWSIVAPVALTETIFKEDSGHPWTSRNRWKPLLASLLLTTVVLNVFGYPLQVSLDKYVLCIILIAASLGLAKALGGSHRPPPDPSRYGNEWFAFSASWVALTFIAPHVAVSPLVTILAATLLMVWAIRLCSMVSHAGTGAKHKAALVYGVVRGSIVLLLLVLVSGEPGGVNAIAALPLAFAIALYARNRMKNRA